MNKDQEDLGRTIDDLDSMAHALLMNLPAQMHVDVMRQSLPEKVAQLKAAFVAATGENPWDE